MAQMRITGLRAGIRVFAALDVPVDLTRHKKDARRRAYETKALAHFNRKHPGANVLEIRLMKFKDSDHSW